MSFLRQHPMLTDALLVECNYNLNEVKTVIKPILNASYRCQLTQFYIHAVSTDKTTFLVTNLCGDRETVHLKNVSSTWLIGRDPSCAVSVSDCYVSRCHGIIGHVSKHGFYLTDVGSSNGTWVNCRRLRQNDRCWLHDGDLLQFGEIQIEFFQTTRTSRDVVLMDATR